MNSSIKRLSILATTLTLAAVFFLPSTVLRGDDSNLLTYITVSQPVQVPGAVLQANTKYAFRRLDADAGLNHVIRVLNEDQTEVLSTFFAVSDQRLEPTSETVLTFMETAAGYPKPVQSWFYPGRVDGYEFVYSKSEMTEIAAHAPGARRAETQAARMSPEESPIAAPQAEPSAPVSKSNTEEIVREKPGEPDTAAVEVPAEPVIESPVVESPAASPVETASEMPASQPASNTATLPTTAGELPLLGLIGIAALGLRQALRRY